MNWCALPHDMTYTGSQGQPSQQQQLPGQPPPPPSQPQPPQPPPPPAPATARLAAGLSPSEVRGYVHRALG